MIGVKCTYCLLSLTDEGTPVYYCYYSGGVGYWEEHREKATFYESAKDATLLAELLTEERRIDGWLAPRVRVWSLSQQRKED